MSDIINAVLLPEPGALVTLYEVDATSVGALVYRFHAYPQAGPIIWQGLEYDPWPVEASGFEMAANGATPAPRLRLSNVSGFVTALVIGFDDLIGARVTRRRTLGRYLDGQPEADPTEAFPDEIWYIEQKVIETPEVVEFELASAMDSEGVQLPRRQIIANSCSWVYRSADCGYSGPPVATAYDVPTSDPALDHCGKRLQSCRLRFGTNGELPFGGFPAAALTR